MLACASRETESVIAEKAQRQRMHSIRRKKPVPHFFIPSQKADRESRK